MLEAAGATLAEERSSARSPLTDAEARALLRSVDEVLVARGRRIDRIEPRQAALRELRGPTGRYRAPMVRVGRTLLVGLQLDSLRELLGA